MKKIQLGFYLFCIWAMLSFFVEKSEQTSINSGTRHEGTCEYEYEEIEPTYPRLHNDFGYVNDYNYQRFGYYETTPKPKTTQGVCTGVDFTHFNPIEKCPQCKRLIFKDSKISTIQTNVLGLPSILEELEMSNTNIQKIEPGAFSNLPSLKVLNLELNQLKKIGKGTFNSHRDLNRLNLSHNLISEIEEDSFHGSIAIQVLDLSHNKIGSIPHDLFRHLNLNSLNISHNLLDTLGNLFCGRISKLKTLRLDNNLLESIPECLNDSMVSDLSISFNNITVFNSTLLPQQLKSFLINNNNLQRIDEDNFNFLNHLETIDISDNPLEGFSPNFQELENLITLKISGINLEIINSNLLKSSSPLRLLKIARNNITSFQKGTFRELTTLENLDISENNMDIIQLNVLKDLMSLEVLNISHNKIEYLQSGVFNGMKKLVQLDLSYNAIEALQPHVFEPLNSLKFLDIKFNKIRTMDVVHFSKFCPSMVRLTIDGNDFSCMSLGEISAYLKIRGIVLEKGNTVSSENINGISCSEKADGNAAEENIDNMRSFFENDFKKTAFYNFFKKFNAHKDVDVVQQNLTSIIKILQTNFSSGFSKDLNVHVEEFMKFENTSFQNFLKELSEIVSKLEKAGKQNRTLSVEDLSSSIHNEIKSFVAFENSSFVNFMNKLSEIVDKMGNNRNNSNFIPEIIKNLHKINAEKLVSTEGSKETGELIGALNQLKFFLIFCTFVVLLFIVAIKIFPRVEKRYFRENTFASNHEMPILS